LESYVNVLVCICLPDKLKGVFDPLVGDTPRIGVKRQIGSRNLWGNAKRQVWNRILKSEATTVGLIHVCLDVGAYQ
jgi:hypothetical protein